MSKTPIALSPVAGFCIKSTTLQPAAFTPQSQPQNVLEPPPAPVPISAGFKVFVNIAWDPKVPPPPQGSEEAIQRAMQGEDVDERNPDGWYVPVVVSDGRQDKDKAGKPSLVFDCIYNTSVKSRTLTDPEFKLFLVELALQRIEAQTSLALSRQIGTPNIASKGKLSPRTVIVPSFLVTESSGRNVTAGSAANTKPLIQEVTPAASSSIKPKGILKAASTPTTPTPILNHNKTLQSRPTWTWSRQGSKIQIRVAVPNLPCSLIEQATLDIEARRFIVHIPDCPVLDVNLGLSDAEIVATAASKTSASLHGEAESEPNNTLTLKRQRDLDVDGANSEWRVAEGVLVISA